MGHRPGAGGEANREAFETAMKTVDVTFQNLDSSEISLTDVRHQCAVLLRHTGCPLLLGPCMLAEHRSAGGRCCLVSLLCKNDACAAMSGTTQASGVSCACSRQASM